MNEDATLRRELFEANAELDYARRRLERALGEVAELHVALAAERQKWTLES